MTASYLLGCLFQHLSTACGRWYISRERDIYQYCSPEQFLGTPKARPAEEDQPLARRPVSHNSSDGRASRVTSQSSYWYNCCIASKSCRIYDHICTWITDPSSSITDPEQTHRKGLGSRRYPTFVTAQKRWLNCRLDTGATHTQPERTLYLLAQLD